MTTRRHVGPPLVVVSAVFAVLFILGVVLATVLAGRTFPSPYEATDVLRAYFAANPTAVRVAGFFQFGASVPLAIYTATITSRLRFQGIRAPGVNIALIGGTLATAFLALSGLVQWSLAMLDPSQAVAFNAIGFAFGGVGHVVALGLLVAGIAVTSGLTRLIPRWTAWVGVVIAFVAEVSFLSLLVPGLDVLLPIARFPAMIWLILVAVQLPRTRRQPVREAAGQVDAESA